MGEEERILKNTFTMKVTQLEKVVDEGGKENLKVTDTKYVKMRAKEVEEQLYFDRAAGINRPVQVVSMEPTKFQINVLYVRADGKMAYAYVVKEDSNGD